MSSLRFFFVMLLAAGCSESALLTTDGVGGGARSDFAALTDGGLPGDAPRPLDIAMMPDFSDEEFSAYADGGLLTSEDCLARPIASCTTDPRDLGDKTPIDFLHKLLNGCGATDLPLCSVLSVYFDKQGCAVEAGYAGAKEGVPFAKCVILALNRARYTCVSGTRTGLTGFCE